MVWSYPDTPELFVAIYDAIDPKLRLFPTVKQLIHDEKTMKIAIDDLYMLAYRFALTGRARRHQGFDRAGPAADSGQGTAGQEAGCFVCKDVGGGVGDAARDIR